MNHIPERMLQGMRSTDMNALRLEKEELKTRYEEQLTALDARASDLVANCDHRTVLVDEEDPETRVCVACGAYTNMGDEVLDDHEDRATLVVKPEVVASSARFSLWDRKLV